jgi:hypothetical protein
MAAARLAARWEVAHMAAVVHMAAGHPTLRWGHPMAAVRPMAVAGPMAVAARMAEGQAATTAEATVAFVIERLPSSSLFCHPSCPVSQCDLSHHRRTSERRELSLFGLFPAPWIDRLTR